MVRRHRLRHRTALWAVGATVLDVDHPERLPESYSVKHTTITAPFQNTRRGEPERGHYIFLTPPGRTLATAPAAYPRVGVRSAEPTASSWPPRVHTATAAATAGIDTGAVPELPDEIAELLDDASEAAGAASDAEVQAFLDEYTKATRPEILAGWVKALGNHFAAGASRHDSTLTVLVGALKEARLGYFTPADAVDMIWPMFRDEVAKPPASR